MANDFYNAGSVGSAHTKARASLVNAQLTSIAAGFDKLPSQANILGNSVTFATDTGVADAYVVTYSPAFTSYAKGMGLIVEIINANTGPCTINVDGLGARSIKTISGDDPGAGDIPAGLLVDLRYDGTNFILMSGEASLSSLVASIYDQFDDRYLGSKSSAPTVDNDGDTLLDGALYWNTTDNTMYVYDLGGTQWVDFASGYDPASVAITGGTISGVSISGITDLAVADGGTGSSTASGARSNLGLGSLAILNSVNNSNWSGDVLTIGNGGTGSATAASARTALGLAIGSDVLAYDADLASIAGLVSAADKMIYYSAPGTAALADLTAFGRSLLDDTTATAARTTLGLGTIATLNAVSGDNWTGTDLAVVDGGTGSSTAAGARTNLGLAIGTDVQAYHARLASLAGLAGGADSLPFLSGADTFTETPLTGFARTILDDADAAAVRTTIGAAKSETIVVKAADETVNNSTTLQDDNHLTASVSANTTYIFELALLCASATANIDIAFSVPSGATGWQQPDGGSAVDLTTEEQISTTGGALGRLHVIKGVIVVSATPGSITLQWAQSVATVEDTKIKQNSYMRLTEV